MKTLEDLTNLEIDYLMDLIEISFNIDYRNFSKAKKIVLIEKYYKNYETAIKTVNDYTKQN